jgi:hypothetical protein
MSNDLITINWDELLKNDIYGKIAREKLLELPSIKIHKNEFIFRVILKNGELTKIGLFFAFIIKILVKISLEKFIPFYLENDKIIFAGIIIKVRNKINALNSPPSYFKGGLIINLFGYQIIRIFYFKIKLYLRSYAFIRKEKQSPFELNVSQKGFGKIENAISLNTINEFNKLLDCKHNFLKYKRDEHPCGWVKIVLHNGGDNLINYQDNSIYKKYLNEILSIKNLLSTIECLSYRNIKHTPEISLFEWKVNKDDCSRDHQFDYEDILHADVAYPSFKVFLYLNDVDENNGPFSYSSYSHKLGFKRLLIEYIISVVYFIKKNSNNKPQPHAITEWLTQRLKYDVTPLVGNSNTLILANVMGFHKRGRFNSTRPRRILYLNFRYIDSGLTY